MKMRKISKALATLLAVLLLFSLGTTAFADEASGTSEAPPASEAENTDGEEIADELLPETLPSEAPAEEPPEETPTAEDLATDTPVRDEPTPLADKPAVAQIGNNDYETLAAAIAAAQDGDTVTLLSNTQEDITIEKSLTLDLGECVLTGSATKSVISALSDKEIEVTIQNGTITGGSTTQGGGISIGTAGTVTLENCTISGNTASNSGGGIYMNGGTVRLTGCQITGNHAGNSGGGIYATTSGKAYGCTCELESTDITGNDAVIGGGVGMGASNYLYNETTAEFVLQSGSIFGNTASKSGGGAYLVGNGSRFTANGGSISGNSAGENGGAIYSNNWRGITLNAGTVTNNTATGHGGAVYIQNVNKTSNPIELEVLYIGSSVVMTGNSAGATGGAISVNDGVTVRVETGAALYNNTAKTMGDDVYASSGNALNLPAANTMSGNRILASTGKAITGWYYDGYESASIRNRWSEQKDKIVFIYDENGKVTSYTKEKTVYYSEFDTANCPYSTTVALKAAHEAPDYTITYEVTGDIPANYIVPDSVTVKEGEDYEVAAVPQAITGIRNGISGTFTFTGWVYDEETVTKLEFITEDKTLNGVWEFTATTAPVEPAPGTDWDVSKSKTATNLDENFESKVTLSLPAAEQQLTSDIVLVLDKSTSATLEEQALAMLSNLKAQTENTGAKVNVGVVIFNKEAHATEGLLDLATEYDAIEAAIKQEIKSGTNTHAGLLAGIQMLDADTSVSADRKYLIFVSDGITYMYNESPTATAWSFENDGSILSWAGPDNWNSKYGSNDAPEDWAVWLGQIGDLVEKDGTTYDYPYGGTQGEVIPVEENQNHAMSIDKALYLTYTTYRETASKYHCYAMTAGTNGNYPWASSFMKFLANGEEVTFSGIQNDIYYLLDAGSKVVDVIGYGEDYDFDFVSDASKLTLTVNGEALAVQDLGDGEYAFGEAVDGEYPYTLTYYANGYNGDTKECFVWNINVPVTNFAPVQLTYTVRLTNPKTEAGTYGQYDGDGSKSYDGLYTNDSATLYPVDSNNTPGEPETFPKPTVSYTVEAEPTQEPTATSTPTATPT